MRQQLAIRATPIGQCAPLDNRLFTGLSFANRKTMSMAETGAKARKLAAALGIEPSLVVRKATPAELKEFWP